MQNNIFGVTNLLVDEKLLDVRSLITTQLNHFACLFIFLHRTVARKVLFESFANTLDIQIIGKSSNRSDTFAAVALLHTHVYLFLRTHAALVARILKGVCQRPQTKDECLKYRNNYNPFNLTYQMY